jgi:ribose 5-phosphate isomerase A
MIAAGATIAAVPTSRATEALCERFRVPTIAAPSDATLPVVIDGADEIDPHFDLIKGGGGALFREKVVALLAERFVVVADASKLVPTLGAFPLPLEVVDFAVPYVARVVTSLGIPVTQRMRDGEAFRTDNGNAIVDCAFGAIPDPAALLASLTAIHGVVSVGLFVSLATDVLIASPDGVRDLTRVP